MRILVFRLENEDSILAQLRKSFPSAGFRKCRASENFEDEGKRLIVIETVPSVRSVMLLDSLEGSFLGGSSSPAISSLRILKRLGALDSVKVIAVPEKIHQDAAVRSICSILAELGAR